MRIKLIAFVFMLLQINLLQAQELLFPPRINILDLDTGFGGVSFGIRIWGWSIDGKVAVSVENWVIEGGQSINFFILDLNSSDTLFYLGMHSFHSEGIEIIDEALYNANSAEILNALQSHDIIKLPSEFLQFPINRDDIIYNAQIINIVHGADEFGDPGILKYDLLVITNDQKKSLRNFVPFLVSEVSIMGYSLSPFENRIMIVVAELSWFQHGSRSLRFIGSYLASEFE